MGTHDYVIVGAGSAGCVLAHRLSERRETTVLLIEAGPPDTNALIPMPKGYRRIHRDPRLMWSFPVDTGGDEAAWQGALVGGKVLGGTSAVNSMLYARGHPDDYDGWVALGAPGWGWPDMLRCFRAIEDHELGESESRGRGGPLHVSAPRCRDSVCAAVIEAGVAMGLPRKRDLNEGDQEGIGYFPATIANGRRVSAARAFLAPIARRPNLTILPGTMVTRILIEAGRAVGVACAGADGAPPSVHRAANEVLLCAGALQTPKLLQLSGIGPAELLRPLGIVVIADSPGVGANLRDHWGLRLQCRLLRSRGANHRLRGMGLRFETLRYRLWHDGVLAAAAADVGAFVRTRPGAGRPDAQLQIAPWSTVPGREPAEVEREPGVQIAVRSLQPASAGSVLIRSANPAVPAAIRASFLSEAEDCTLMVAMVGYVRQLARQPALQAFLGEETFPGPEVGTAEEIVAVCRRWGTPGSHYAGTCRMGQGRMAVVDERLRVRGLAGLRVVDGSIMPTLVSGNTNGPIMAIAWRAADLIQEER